MMSFDEELIQESIFIIFEEQTIHLEEKERKRAENREVYKLFRKDFCE